MGVNATSPSPEPRVVLLGRSGCHLCDEAREVVDRVATDLGVTWQERSVDDDPDLVRRYGDQVPVTFVDGHRHDFWRVDEGRLRAALR
jgi:glutaredoxin